MKPRAFLLPWLIENDRIKVHKMTRLLEELERPYTRDEGRLVRNGRHGTYWQTADGLIVRVAAGESAREVETAAEAAHRALLMLAVDEACGE